VAAKAKRPTVKMVRDLENKLRANEIALEEFPIRVSQLEALLAEKARENDSAEANVEMYRSEAQKMTALSATRRERIADMGHEINNADVKIAALEKELWHANERAKVDKDLVVKNNELTVINNAWMKDHAGMVVANSRLHETVKDLGNRATFRPRTGLVTNDISRCVRLSSGGDTEESWAIIWHKEEEGKFSSGGITLTRQELNDLFHLLHG